MKNPPVLIAVIGFFAAMAGFSYLFLGMQLIGFDWFGVLGDLPRYEQVGLWGWLAIVTGLVWLFVAFGLWALQPWARVFALVMAGLALLEAVLAMLSFPGTGIGLGMALMPALILWYLNTAEVKTAFGEGAAADRPTDPAPEPAPLPAVPVAFAAPVAAPVAVAAVEASAAPEVAPAPVAAPIAAPIAAAAAPGTDDAPRGGAHSMPIEDVEGIGPAHGATLAAAGIRTTDDLLAAGARPYDRERIAEATGISSKLIREWVDNVDLMRVPGVGPQYSDLLEAAGVGSPAELAQRNAANLAATVQEVVAARPGTVRRIPTEAEIDSWIEAAATLEPVVEH